MRSRLVGSLAFTIALSVAVGCSSSSPTSPGQVGGNLPGAAAPAPGAKSNDLGERLTLKGRVTDARTGEAIPKVTILAVQTEAPPSDLAPGSTDLASGSNASGSAAAPSPTPRLSARPIAAPLKTTADEKGNFEIKDLPSGTYAITAYRKGYEAVSFVGGRPASGQVNLSLISQSDNQEGNPLTGKVRMSSRKPAVGVHVAAALEPGLFGRQSTVTGSDGAFSLTGLPPGKHLLAAWTLGEPGEIKTWGIARDVNVALGKDKKSSHPEIMLRAVSKPIIIAGKVAPQAKGIRPRQVQVFLSTDSGQDVPLLSRSPDQDGYFRFSLPAPEEGTTYHLLASGVDAAGNAAYAHLHKLAGPSHSDDLILPELPATPSVDPLGKLRWSWTAIPDVSAYRVRLESTGDDPLTLWEGWTTGTSIELPEISGLALNHGDLYRYTITAVKAQSAFELPEIQGARWALAASLAPREFVAGEPQKEEAPRTRVPSLREQGQGELPQGGALVPPPPLPDLGKSGTPKDLGRTKSKQRG